MNSNAEFRFDDKMNFDFHAPLPGNADLEAALEQFVERELVRGLAEQDRAYFFKHALVQETAYASLMLRERRRLHGLVADIVEQSAVGTPEEHAALLAHHYGIAENFAKTFEYATQAGDAAAGNYANVEARQQFLTALRALERLGDDADTRRHIDTILQYVELAASSDETAQNLARLAQAKALAQTLPDEGGEGDELRRARVHYFTGLMHVMRNELPQALGEFEQVLPVAQAYGKQEMIVVPANFIGRVLFAQGHFARAEQLFAQAVKPLEEAGNWTEWVLTMGFLGDCLSAQGQYAEGYMHCTRALERARAEKNLSGQAVAHVFLAFHYLMGGEWRAARDAAKTAIELAAQSGDRFFEYVGLNFLCWAETNLDDCETALKTWTHTMAYGKQLGGQLLGADWMAAIRAFIALGQGNTQEACALAEEAVLFARGVGGIMAEGLAERAWGRALTGMGPSDLAKAHEHFAASLKLFEQGNARLEAARTEEWWGAVLCATGERDAAQTHFNAANAALHAAGLEGRFSCL